ncbi:MAG: DUF86 domain-containing protein [Chloroflexota bacterium]|nr:DUF86 domain-containing protein [Chloroflexota bacterium]
MRDDRQRLADILEAIENIERYTGGGRGAFDRNELVQTWVLFQLMVIGEAVRALSDAFRSGHPEVAWPQIVALRNNVVHHYFGIDEDIIWEIVTDDIPALKRLVVTILSIADDLT